MNSNCSNLLDLRNIQEQVKKRILLPKIVLTFTVWINCSSDLKNFENSRPSARNFKSFSWSLDKYHFHNFWTIFCETADGGAYIGESASFHIFLNMLAVEEFSPYAYALHIALSKVIVYKSSHTFRIRVRDVDRNIHS